MGAGLGIVPVVIDQVVTSANTVGAPDDERHTARKMMRF